MILSLLACASCATWTQLVAALENPAPAPGAPAAPGRSGPPAAVGARGGLAGVWVAEENSLDPQFYMSFTQVLTFYPDGSVAYTKSEGGASRVRIDDNWVRFRSWHEGARPPNVVGRWSSDGSQVSVQFSRKTAAGRVRGPNEIALSRMGVLDEGATLVFKRQPR
jgi:hypothetical protein